MFPIQSASTCWNEHQALSGLMFAIGSDYHAQLENYGALFRILHKALVTTPTPIGWWSWTAF